MSIFDKKLSVIIPAYNEEKNIYENLLKMTEIINSFSNNYELVVVNDGSKDATKDEIDRAVKNCPNIIQTGYEKNKGKGGAIKTGVRLATGDFIAFLDADLDLSPLHIKAFMERMEETNSAAVIGSKLHKDSKVNYPKARKVMSFCYYLILKVMFHLDVKDTQTGVKLFNAKELGKIIFNVTTNGFAYDIEILALLAQNGGRIEEMPVELVFQRAGGWGRIKISDIMAVVKDTIRIYRNVKRVRKMGIWCEGSEMMADKVYEK